MHGWKPSNVTTFQEHLDDKLLAMQSYPCSVTEDVQAKCEEIEAILLEVAEKCRQTGCADEAGSADSKRRLHELIERRRAARKAGSKDDVRSVSKVIRKEISAIAKQKKTARIRKVLEEFKDLKRIADIRGNGKRVCISSMIDSTGTERTARHDISEVFADFFESLYHGNGEVFEATQYDRGGDVKAERVTTGEVRTQLRKMKLRKAADERGLVAELLRNGSDMLIGIIADLFSAVLIPGTTVPEYWKASSIRVLLKKGDSRRAENYRPICVIPILYKLFSKVLCSRIKDQLVAYQPPDQAGFRPGYSCDDHLFAITMLTEKCNEFNMPLWVATLDFKKAFDSISHARIWESLREHEVPTAYIDVLSRLYHEQCATVKCDTTSRQFHIGKGTKQGDPISPFIFNAVLEQVM